MVWGEWSTRGRTGVPQTCTSLRLQRLEVPAGVDIEIKIQQA